jgi:hypothetical protein
MKLFSAQIFGAYISDLQVQQKVSSDIGREVIGHRFFNVKARIQPQGTFLS